MANHKIKNYRIIRWLVQILFLVLFIYFFIQTRYGVSILFQNVFFRIDPLIFVITSIAYRTLIVFALPSIILIIGTLIFGRFFCGFVCPLGTIIDIFDSIVRRKGQGKLSLKNVKYLILLFLIVAALIGGSFLHFFDPLVILERSLTLVFYPAFTKLMGFFTNLRTAVYTETFIALIVFVIVIGLSLIGSRFWCRNLCPLGGLLGFLAKFSWFRFRFTGECKKCGICQKICPTDAIDFKNSKIDSAECIDCLACQNECPDLSIKYSRKISVVPFDITRRQVIFALGSGLVAVPLAKSLLYQKIQGRLLRPPGSIPESNFLDTCIHCGKCMKVCPTNGLQPCILEAGVNGIWTPRLVPRIGGCEKNCNLCGQVCPTSAIRKLSLEEKTYAVIGKAVIDRTRCIAWEQDKICLICDEACPYNAIDVRRETINNVAIPRPFVDERICVGCGLCESRCPIEGPAAIQVFSIGAERKKSGSYITQEKRELRECEQKPEEPPSGFILDDN